MRVAVAIAAVLALTGGAQASPVDQTAAPRSEARPALNHVYIVVDGPTFAALRDNPTLAAVLGRTDGGLPDYAPPQADADRIFFRGRETYLEIFAPDNRFEEPVGKVGLGLGLDASDGFDAVERAWRVHCGDRARRTPVEYRRSTPPTPWYDAVQCDDTAAGPDLAVWAMVYRPEFQRWQTGSDATEPPLVRRADILAPRADAGQGRFDIVGLTLSLSPDLRDRLISQLVAAGFQRHDRRDATELEGDGLRLRLVEPSTTRGLIAIDLTVASEAALALPLGAALLTADAGGRATLQFSSLQMPSAGEDQPPRR
ncbi:hypothetical protein E4M02_08405 [Brevundimonas sp. S30B]|uniref:DUF5829 family protein n=1 Tax=unclassified Brevundimonas TaxID=2622653 RepID=UPI001071B2E4|nr:MULTISPECIES: DUF5829 family protein [unclassified Brevundimonas]QBX38384.1 hypothetical protein E4M01_11840 [Brevundimonas sp. MF30-B]TFW02092.1 hypothetical protein E4M02_08405 [Brevundimonas sp. S30B]